MAEDDSGERTEDATTTKREEFRRQGQVVQSKEVSSVLLLLGSAFALWILGRFFLEQINDLYRVIMSDQIVVATREGGVGPAVKFAATKMLFILGPFLLINGVLSFASTVLQIGFLYNEEGLDFKFERLDPVEGFKRMFQMRSWVEGFKACIKLTIVGAIAYSILKSEIATAPHLVTLSLAQFMTYLGGITGKLVMSIGVLMIVVAVLDYGYLRWDLEQRMKMTKQEVREEHKSREGDPMVKSRIRKIQRDLANRRMMDSVPKAEVIITNPTHIAIALKYDDNLPAPQLIAKGAGLIAERIKAVAKEHGIPVIENKPLARAIYKTLKLGQLIPRELYQAVAEVLALVFKLKRKVVQ